MDKDNEFPLSTRELLDGLPPARPVAEIREKYRGLISDCVGEYARAFDAGATRWGGLSGLTVSLAREVATRFGRLVEWADDLIPKFDVSAAGLAPMYAARAIGAPEVVAAVDSGSYAFEKQGDGCSARIVLEVVDSSLDMAVSLLDGEGAAILPFFLTIRDRETHRTLLDRKEFRSGAARIRGVERGEYEVRCEQMGRVCEFAVAVRE